MFFLNIDSLGVDIVDRRIIKSVKSIASNVNNPESTGDYDGICYIKTRRRGEYIFINHETDTNAKVSRITYRHGRCKKLEVWTDKPLQKLCSMYQTPWNTVLTNEEHAGGYVHELHPTDRTVCKTHKLLGKMKHEKTIYVPTNRPALYDFYTTCDDFKGGGVYKFAPKKYKDLSKGKLYGFTSTTAKAGDKVIRGMWTRIHDTEKATELDGLVLFKKIEGLTYNEYDNHIYFCVSAGTKPDGSIGLGYIYKLNPRTCKAKLVVNCDETNGKLANPDNIQSDRFGNLYICEGKHTTKNDPNRLVYIDSKTHGIKTLVQGTDETGEVTGIEFDKSTYDRFWLNWKNGTSNGQTYSELVEIHLRR